MKIKRFLHDIMLVAKLIGYSRLLGISRYENHGQPLAILSNPLS
ncbi:MAG TPA: hypothetical protein VGL97_18885 [Bryobacteraceae bacterium]